MGTGEKGVQQKFQTLLQCCMRGSPDSPFISVSPLYWQVVVISSYGNTVVKIGFNDFFPALVFMSWYWSWKHCSLRHWASYSLHQETHSILIQLHFAALKTDVRKDTFEYNEIFYALFGFPSSPHILQMSLSCFLQQCEIRLVMSTSLLAPPWLDG